MVRGLLSLSAVLALTASARPLPFFYDLYTFRGEHGGTTVVAAFAVPVERLEREREDGEVRYRFVEGLERLTGRRLRPQKVGRKRKQK